MSDLLNIGRTGLNASKKSLETTGHNIANVNTEGYSRQRVNQTTNTPITKGGTIHGTGVRVKSVTRINDDFINKRLQKSITNSEFFEQRMDRMSQVESIFNEIDSEGLNQVVNKFFNSFRELANQPENETIRSVVRDQANLVVQDFRRINENLDAISSGIDANIKTEVIDINQTAEHIASLNKKIQSLEAVHEEVGDLRDQRDLAIRKLAESFDVNTYVDSKGKYVVSAKGVGTLVTGTLVQKLEVGTRNKEDSANGLAGSAEIYFEGKPAFPLTHKFKGGKLSSMIKVRNEDIVEVKTKVNHIAYNLSKSVNAIHRRGYVNRSLTKDEAGNVSSVDNKGLTTGIDFFKEPTSEKDAALNMDLSSAVKEDLSNVVTALSPNAPGDNRVSLAISKLQHERILGENETTLEEYYLQTVGKIGLETGKARLDSEQSEGLKAQAIGLRERLVGVSIDEEAANMVRYQHAYEASAKIMQTADEMFKTVIGIKR
ncbi:flagellar hook-associated protein FlgK [Halobacteriovorax sp. HLS]|uniref:flagellar hook-associated protein FlgK n=1 Tax=Halobacteriovorax sp. HLS TaxID=2234000 RepID=UPI000FDA6083|nr:flagellar hook-associated protein FlgK [Halobacteriovorax sp. HLS]